MSRGLTTELKAQIVSDFRRSETDTGSAEVQIALLQHRIKQLTAHVQTHKHDHHTRLGLTNMVAQQRRLINFLKREDFSRYKAVIEKLGMRR